jgi:hypothetical protein
MRKPFDLRPYYEDDMLQRVAAYASIVAPFTAIGIVAIPYIFRISISDELKIALLSQVFYGFIYFSLCFYLVITLRNHDLRHIAYVDQYQPCLSG